jgi:ComF family protein
MQDTKTIKPSICLSCGEPRGNQSGSICGRCLTSEIYFSTVRSWALFEDPLKKAIHSLKYKKNIGLGESLAAPLAQMVLDYGWQIDLVTAVPLDSERLRERGFNQSMFLARPLAWVAGIPLHSEAIVRVRKTRPQVGLSRDERGINLSGAFQSDPDICLEKNILVIDDVITTGSTINACAKSLLEAGAHQVYGLTLARSAHV